MAKIKVFKIGNALSAGLEETITAAHNYSGDLRVDIIPIKKIEADPENPRDFLLTFDDLHQGVSPADADYARKQQEKDSLQTMASSIKEQGIINPIVVYKNGEKYRLIAGERRTLASILAGKSDIQAKILDNKPNDLKISILQWIENIERSDLTLWERLRNLEKMVSFYSSKKNTTSESISLTELSQLIGCSKPHAMNYKAVLMADDQLKACIKEDKIKNLEKAALIANIKSSALKQDAIQACLKGATYKKLKMMAEQDSIKTAVKEKTTPAARGRQATSVNLGATKNIAVARIIFDSVLNHNSLSHLTSHFKTTDLNDYKAITETFKDLLRKLEELHA